jgi:hypothetical protein
MPCGVASCPDPWLTASRRSIFVSQCPLGVAMDSFASGKRLSDATLKSIEGTAVHGVG